VVRYNVGGIVIEGEEGGSDNCIGFSVKDINIVFQCGE